MDCGFPESRPGRQAEQELPDDNRESTMAQTFTGRKRVRKFFGKIHEVAEMPNLIEVQKASYDQFLMVKDPPGGRSEEGRPSSSRYSRSAISQTPRSSTSSPTNSIRRSTTSTSAVSAA